jgi:hypothetical protein
MYTSFCHVYEDAGKDLQALVQKFMAPYSPAYLPAARYGPARLTPSEMWQALELFLKYAEECGHDWDTALVDIERQYGYIMQNMASNQLNKAEASALRGLWQKWKASKKDLAE